MMKNISILLLVIGCTTNSLSAKSPQVPTFIERNGIVAIEAEHFTFIKGRWEEVEGRSANTSEMQGSGGSWDSSFVVNTNHETTISFSNILPVTTKLEKLKWAFPNHNAIKLAWLKNSPDKVALFIYPKDSEMPGMTASALRIGSFFPTSNMQESVWDLFGEITKYASKGKKNILLLIGTDQPEEKDAYLQHYLSRKGYNIKCMRDKSFVPSYEDSCDLLIISESIRNSNLENRPAKIHKPVIVCKNGFMQFMGMVVQQSTWQPSRGQSGNAMLIRSGKHGDFLRYSIYFRQAGNYYLSLLGQNNGSIESAKCKVVFSSFKPSTVNSSFEIPLNMHPNWTTIDSQTNQNSQSLYEKQIVVPAAGWYNLDLLAATNSEEKNSPYSRYPNWRVDKIYLSLNNNIPTGNGPEETINVGEIKVPDEIANTYEFLPKQVIQIRDNFAVIEAEDIDHSAYWELLTEPKGYSGSGYLKWIGPNRSISIEEVGGNDDYLFVRQGPREEWLILQIEAQDSGTYFMDVRNIHARKDGDNDAWINLLGYKPYENGSDAKPVKRITDGHLDGIGFTWLDWSPALLTLHKGVNIYYIAGRSVGFGIDRIILYRTNDELAKENATKL